MNGSGTIIAPRLRRRPCPARARRQRRCAQGFAGLGESAEGFAPVVPGRTFAFPADHGPHPEFRIEWWYVTANLTDASGAAYGAQWTLFRQAIAAGRAAARAGPTSRSGWAMPPSPAPIRIASPKRLRAAASARPASRQSRFTPGSMPGRCAGSMPMRRRRMLRRSSSRRRAPISATRCGSTPTRPLVLQGDAGYSRKSERGAGVVLLQPAVFHGDRPHHHRRQARRGHRHRPGWIANGAASRWPRTRPDGTGSRCISNAGEKLMLFRLRQSDGAALLLGQLDRSRRPLGRDCSADDIAMTPTGDHRDRGPQGADRHGASRLPTRGACDRMHAAECRKAGWARAFPIGKARSALPAATRGRLSGDDGVLKRPLASPAPRGGGSACFARCKRGGVTGYRRMLC